jgi:hypothetical protein
MEALRNAERAAGFAMAAADDIQDSKPERERDANQWRPGEALIKSDAPKARARWLSHDWVRSIASLFGRGAPA